MKKVSNMGACNGKGYSIKHICNYSLIIDNNLIYPIRKFQEKNHLELMYMETFLSLFNPDKDIFSLDDLVQKLAVCCKDFSKCSRGESYVSDDYIHEKICRHYVENKYQIVFAIDMRNIPHYACDDELKKIKKAGGKDRRQRLNDRHTYDNPLNRIHGMIIYDDNPCQYQFAQNIQKMLCIRIICANPFASRNGLKGIGSMLLLYTILLGKIYNFDKVILEVTNDKAEIENECDINATGEDDTSEMYERRAELNCLNMKKIKKIAREWGLPLSGLKLHFINRILWEEFIAEDEDSDEETDEDSDEDSDEETDEESDEESDEECPPLEYYNSNWQFDEYEPIVNDNIDYSLPWDFMKKDKYIYGYGGLNYQKGKESTIKLYNWYEKYGFIENHLLNTFYKCFEMAPLPAMEFNIRRFPFDFVCKAFLENKKLQKPNNFVKNIY